MKDRLFRRRDIDRSRSPDDTTAFDARAGGPAWDRPDDDGEFAPPLRDDDLHWAFRPPTPEHAPDADGRPPHGTSRHWGFGEPGHFADDIFDRGWTLEDGARLVTAGPREPGVAPRDPAQPGIFDPYDSFAPTSDEPWWGPKPPAEGPWTTSGASVAAPASGERLPVAGPADPGSVFGDLFVDRRGAATADEALPSVSVGAAAEALPAPPDPREWPPIPGALLPSVPQSLAESGTAEPDGRRFTWPPPQPRVATSSTSESASRPAASEADQASLWRTAAEPAAERDAGDQEPPAQSFTERAGPEPGRQTPHGDDPGTYSANRTLLTIVLTVAIVLALVLLFARFVAPLLT